MQEAATSTSTKVETQQPRARVAVHKFAQREDEQAQRGAKQTASEQFRRAWSVVGAGRLRQKSKVPTHRQFGFDSDCLDFSQRFEEQGLVAWPTVSALVALPVKVQRAQSHLGTIGATS